MTGASTEPEPPPRDRDRRPPSWEREPGGDTTLESNWLITLRRERYRSRKSGISHDFYVVHLADAVNVIALTTDDRVILVEQFRAGSAGDSLETPGGLLDPGEDPATAGARELLEETGYAGDPAIVLGTVWSCPSLLTSRITTILIPNARKVAEPNCDVGEELRLQLVPAGEIPGLIRSGRIGHALAVQGLLWWLVAELPGTPFAQDGVFRANDRQFRLWTVMAAIAVFALVFWLTRVPGSPLASLAYLIPSALLIGSYLIVANLIDPMPRTSLTASMPRYGHQAVMRVLATVGLMMFLWNLIAMVSAWLGGA